jgi:hypothetical protein
MSCEKNDDIYIFSEELLIGYWVNLQMNDTLYTFDRSDQLKENEYGCGFKTGGIFIERKNSGWCGTPPITYDNFEGAWVRNDSIINIFTRYWGGTADYRWKIIHVDSHKLKISKLSEEYHFYSPTTYGRE